MRPTAIVAPYATSPPPTATSRLADGAEAEFYSQLRTLPNVQGYEVPLLPGGVLHPLDEAWVLSQLVLPLSTCGEPSMVLTCVPATCVAIAEDAQFGLASDDPAGRAAAVELIRKGHAAAARANAAAGRSNFVIAVELHSGPSRPKGASSAASLQRSLEEIAAWDWAGASLLVEHCDAFTPAFPPVKGFLTFEEELAAVRGARAALGEGGSSLGFCVNWARSVLESRDPGTALAHCRAAGAEGLLLGLMFSGCTGEAGDYGPWVDCHAPLDVDAPGSLLTAATVREAVQEARKLSSPQRFVGCKVKLAGQPSAEQRAAANGRIIAAFADLL